MAKAEGRTCLRFRMNSSVLCASLWGRFAGKPRSMQKCGILWDEVGRKPGLFQSKNCAGMYGIPDEPIRWTHILDGKVDLPIAAHPATDSFPFQLSVR
jgi:hypothetical protein